MNPQLTRVTTRRGGALAVLVGLLVSFLAVLATPGSTPPLYDGLGFPDEPYRWLQPPPGAPTTPAWTPAGGRLEVVDGTTRGGKFESREQGPQVLFMADPQALRPPAGATAVDVDARAVPLPGPVPEGTTVVSNVYRFGAAAVGAAGPVSFVDGKKYLINMRADTATDQVVLLHHWDGAQWVQRATFQVGTEIYAGTVQALGDYVLLRMPPGAPITVQHSKPSPLPGTTGAGGATASDAGASPPSTEPPGLIDKQTGVSAGRVWWVVAGFAGLLGAALVTLRIVLARRRRDPA